MQSGNSRRTANPWKYSVGKVVSLPVTARRYQSRRLFSTACLRAAQIASPRNHRASGITSFIVLRVALSLFKAVALIGRVADASSLYVDERTCSLIRIKVFPDCYAFGPQPALLQLAENALHGLVRQSRFQTSSTADWRT